MVEMVATLDPIITIIQEQTGIQLRTRCTTRKRRPMATRITIDPHYRLIQLLLRPNNHIGLGQNQSQPITVVITPVLRHLRRHLPRRRTITSSSSITKSTLTKGQPDQNSLHTAVVASQGKVVATTVSRRQGPRIHCIPVDRKRRPIHKGITNTLNRSPTVLRHPPTIIPTITKDKILIARIPQVPRTRPPPHPIPNRPNQHLRHRLTTTTNTLTNHHHRMGAAIIIPTMVATIGMDRLTITTM